VLVWIEIRLLDDWPTLQVDFSEDGKYLGLFYLEMNANSLEMIFVTLGLAFYHRFKILKVPFEMIYLRLGDLFRFAIIVFGSHRFFNWLPLLFI
jgi:hypothetical protein